MSADSPLPLDQYPQIVFGESGTRSASHFEGKAKSGTSTVSQKSGTESLSQNGAIGKSGTRSASHKCLMCPERITGRAKTCSDNCRRASSRRKERIESTLTAIESQLKQLMEYADEWPDLWPDVMRAVNHTCVQAAVVSRYVAPKGDNR